MAKKLKELSNVDIDRMASSLRGYGGCMSKDELPRSLGRKFYVVNMQDSDKGGGTHWVLVDNRQQGKARPVIYFDSVMRELTIAARVLPLFFNTLRSPVNFSPHRVKLYHSYYSHML